MPCTGCHIMGTTIVDGKEICEYCNLEVVNKVYTEEKTESAVVKKVTRKVVDK
jgi:hypothetical protein